MDNAAEIRKLMDLLEEVMKTLDEETGEPDHEHPYAPGEDEVTYEDEFDA